MGHPNHERATRRRVQTDYEGNVEQTCMNLPYGNGEICTPTPAEYLYAGLQREGESGLDHADARQYEGLRKTGQVSE